MLYRPFDVADVMTNAHYSKERRVDMVFGIGYDDNLKKAIQNMNQIFQITFLCWIPQISCPGE